MQLVDVDVVRLQSLQAGFEVLPQPAGNVAVGLDVAVGHDRLVVLVDVVAELGGDDHLVATLPECLAEEMLAVSGAVVGGGVEERDAEVESALQGAQRLGVVDLAPAGWRSVEREWTADRPAPHAESADLDAGPTEHTSEGCCHGGDDMAVTGHPESGADVTIGSSASEAQPADGRVDAKLSEQALAGRAEAADGSPQLVARFAVRQGLVALEEEQYPSIIGIEASNGSTDSVGDLTAFVRTESPDPLSKPDSVGCRRGQWAPAWNCGDPAGKPPDL